MKVFVTGAAGFIGRAVVSDLLSHGHTVLGLSRSASNTETLTKLGAQIHEGSLEDLESLKAGARAADGVIHLAFLHGFDDFANSVRIDKAAIDAMGDSLAGTGKPLVIASGTLGVSTGKLSDEDTDPDRSHPMAVRYESADLVYQLSREKDIRGSVIRLSPVVHGTEDWGFVPMLIGISKKNGFVINVDGGKARWPAVHKVDAAVLFRLALEKGVAGGTYNAVAEQEIQIKEVNKVIAEKLGLKVEEKGVEEAGGSLGWMTGIFTMDTPTSSEKTRERLGWRPEQIGLLEDMEANYF